MTVRTVIVDGVSIEVELTEEADGTWSARVGDRTFTIEMPNAPAPKRREAAEGSARSADRSAPTSPGRSSQSTSTWVKPSRKAKWCSSWKQ